MEAHHSEDNIESTYTQQKKRKKYGIKLKTNCLKPKPFEQKDLTVESEDLSSCESDWSSHSWSRDEDTEDSESDTSMRSKVNKRKYDSTTESVAQKERKHGNSNQLNKTLENGFPTSTPAKKRQNKDKG